MLSVSSLILLNYLYRSLEADPNAGKPPVPAKKAGSPVSAMFSGLRQKIVSVEQRLYLKLINRFYLIFTNLNVFIFRLSGHTSNDTSDGISSSKPSGEPVLMSVSGTQPTDAPLTESFDQVERSSMLNDPRAGR